VAATREKWLTTVASMTTNVMSIRCARTYPCTHFPNAKFLRSTTAVSMTTNVVSSCTDLASTMFVNILAHQSWQSLST
jgi:hypothetical protein